LEKPNERTWSKVDHARRDLRGANPIHWLGELKRDIENFKAALLDVKVEEAFLPVAAPSSAIPDRKNEYYRNDEDLLVALAEA